MTETYGSTPVADEIVTDEDSITARLDRQADAILEEADAAEAARAASLREALRQDAEQARLWARERADLARTAVQAEPMKATLYALGMGVLIGLLVAR